ncbi:MAG: F0F1 ATP synthase subunit epsilon [Oleibacter sp.]|nr:F0F1 ATP synthase subunit epsilon [Thalassolituus sp.]
MLANLKQDRKYARIKRESNVSAAMTLKILLPNSVFSESHQVHRIVAMTPEGAFGILSHRRDCIAALSAGILVFEIKGAEETYVAVDEGILVKTGAEVLVSVRNAKSGFGLDELRDAVEQEFKHLDEQAQTLRFALTKMENGLMNRLASFHQDVRYE